ncbi:DUF3667 domain-containing protein [Mangrovimonas futianensis]|uniref:DUF3667 domain-containing protein n=1 Tax=Mangrovimonas futianensis TaxID=2895523 RepID=UPI001E3A7165|nr:DUF3667 domain-containing protein [Mangrovimonas futianensis]MCF1422303.1 DUF3667 domain-containing protein [Mangrovimonas futianensis]
MTTSHCLNCNKELVGKFCTGCGQKADTRRISFKNFVFNDILHGTFSIEKGMVFTAKQALLRPGKAALEYIYGKRRRYYNLFLFGLFLFGLILFLRHFYEQLAMAQGDVINDTALQDEASKRLDRMISEKRKLIVFLFVPFAAINSLLLFKRKSLNLSEHFIIAGMILLGMLLISTMGNLLFFLYLFTKSQVIATSINYGTPVLVLGYIAYGYYNAFASDYSRWGIILRILLFFILMILQACILLLAFIGFATNWEFGAITFSPFG